MGTVPIFPATHQLHYSDGKYIKVNFFLRLSSCQKRENLLRLPGILGKAGLLQVTTLSHTSQMSISILVRITIEFHAPSSRWGFLLSR